MKMNKLKIGCICDETHEDYNIQFYALSILFAIISTYKCIVFQTFKLCHTWFDFRPHDTICLYIILTLIFNEYIQSKSCTWIYVMSKC